MRLRVFKDAICGGVRCQQTLCCVGKPLPFQCLVRKVVGWFFEGNLPERRPGFS